MAEEKSWSEKRKTVEWEDTVKFLGTMGLPEHKLTLTRKDVESGRVGGYNDEGLYARHGKHMTSM
jgi:glycerol-3-phosphate dehydrogenase